MPGSNPNFPYPPLADGVGAIRILTIHPADFSEALVCTLGSHTFSEHRHYAALSYTWDDAYRDNSALPTSKSMIAVPPELRSSVTWDGRSQGSQGPQAADSSTLSELESNKPDPITINAHPFLVHHNLHLCMLHLRSPTHPLKLWIDAVCINQDDTDECNKQVAIMSFIYSRADKVIAWLGAKPFPNQQNPFHCMSMDWKAGESSQLGAALAGDAKMRYTTILDKHTLSRLADSSYWTRLWIVQEACLAYDLEFVYGSNVWSFDRIRMLDPLEGIPHYDTDEKMRYGPMLRLIEARLARHTDVTRLENLIERFRGQACSDLKDRVYGLIGLANDARPFSDDGYQTFKKGRIKINRLRSFYDIWEDVVNHVYSLPRPIPRAWTLPGPAGTHADKLLRTLDREEREISIVRTSAIVQEALGQQVKCPSQSIESQGYNSSMRGTIRVIGYAAGKIVQMGPDYESLVRSPEANHEWVESWDEYYREERELQELRAMNEEYMFRILRFDKEDLSRIRHIRSLETTGWLMTSPALGSCDDQTGRWSELQSFPTQTSGILPNQHIQQQEPDPGISGVRICLGSNYVVALVPAEAEVGDVIVRFWNCRVAIVMRPFPLHTDRRFGLLLVGRADVARTDEQQANGRSDPYAERSLSFNARACPGRGAVDVEMDLPTLQIITTSLGNENR
ncbi:heterokaryon incompatibility protein-domain-containing protein [Cercophora newfieldiana]|uniref:Heterokaryon incompatibility protein-domain-containing protein n=1 Tax=Cercophora newfieldiana TaxID=92897 RepID=A0AA40CRV9_9PEZI|nr:heterokaryon incompatibility protein-domain-containing protein [Cercophora newfieldiana]